MPTFNPGPAFWRAFNKSTRKTRKKKDKAKKSTGGGKGNAWKQYIGK
jgi:hypothetical protein